MAKKETNGYGIAGLIFGIFSVLTCVFLFPIGLICGILGIVCSVKQKKISQNGISTAGLIISIIGLVISTLLFLIFFLAFAGGLRLNF